MITTASSVGCNTCTVHEEPSYNSSYKPLNAIYRNKKDFAFTCFSIDKALEQSLNKDTKSNVSELNDDIH